MLHLGLALEALVDQGVDGLAVHRLGLEGLHDGFAVGEAVGAVGAGQLPQLGAQLLGLGLLLLGEVEVGQQSLDLARAHAATAGALGVGVALTVALAVAGALAPALSDGLAADDGDRAEGGEAEADDDGAEGGGHVGLLWLGGMVTGCHPRSQATAVVLAGRGHSPKEGFAL